MEDVEKKGGGGSYWVWCIKQLLPSNPRHRRVYIDPVCYAVSHHSTNQKILINFEKIMIGCLMSFDHIK